MPSTLFSINSELYVWEGSRLVKAAKIKQAPGQMSLFEESQHPRGSDGKFVSKGQEGAGRGQDNKWDKDVDALDDRLQTYVKQASPAIEKEFKSGINAFRNKIKSMTINELENSDVEVYLSDEIWTPIVEGLEKEIKSWEHEDAHRVIDRDLDLEGTIEVINPRLQKLYDKALDDLEKLATERIDRPLEIDSEAASEMNIKGGELLEQEPQTVQEALALNQKITDLYHSIKAQYTEELKSLGVTDADWEELDGELEWMLDNYSTDPEDYEGWD